MTGWWILLIIFGGLALTIGIELVTTLICGSIGTTYGRGRVTKHEPQLFRQVFTTELVVFIVSAIFTVVVALVILHPFGY
jgi:hypothetical protein